jgi:hypothetical protein
MTDERRRRDEQRLHRAQEIAHALRERQAELQLELLERSRLRSAPLELAAYRRAGTPPIAWPVPDDVC